MTGTLSATEIESLAANASGRLLRPADRDYENARHVFNAMIDRRPALILRCASPDDVARGIDFARTHGLALSVRGGGHSVAGHAVCDGGVMLDLSGMKGIKVDTQRQIAVAEPGLTLGEFDRATQRHGLATTLGVVSVTGIAGLTLGGGIGWLNGKYGLACDNLIEADIVTADGGRLRVSEDENEGLLWGLRGGGGNFGVVTSLSYRLHPVTRVLAGPITYPSEQAAAAMNFYHEFAGRAPDELSTAGGLGRDEEGRPSFSVTVCWCGDLDEGARVLEPLRSFGPPAWDGVQPMDYLALQSSADAAFPEGRLHYWKAAFLRNLSEAAIEVILEFVGQMPSPYSAVGLQQMCGLASRVSPTATAFFHRAPQYDFLILSQWDESAETDRNVDWTRRFFRAMEPFLEGSVYSNNLAGDDEARVRAAYGDNYERLSALKARYDPANVFSHNANIRPSEGT